MPTLAHIQWVAYKTMVRKELTRMFRIWTQTFLPSVITTTLYFLIFGTFIGSQVGKIGDHTYMQFIVPGLVMMTVITNSFTNVIFSFYGAKFQKNLEELMVAPVSYWTIIAGFITGGVLRSLIVGTLTLIVSMFFTQLHLVHFFAVIFFIVTSSTLFALAGLVNGIYAKSFDDMSIFLTFVLTPLTYLGGVFYSVKLLSPIWQYLSFGNPILYMVNGFRYGFLGVSDVSVWVSVVVTLVFSAIFFFWALYLFSSGRALRN